ncbi:L-ascorbate metabolism protein UlaG, beta-lactamase superfamily [Aquiflexum balticum DSM 16537]|uniref:L-ascorbate metabolism protein UlaG, beta-lactamase superfamily n=1 Tax=Aquiflexum balticum DSM 16537 TaxID=758820 RepID=A0A1W2H002_9BACT|nr:MBL fold metallo-hydrolase [Aquiflexum balticum]SMD42267.1 L-ascorbate metabolism protein UlaG, beta-lactamase superfamily [Aquiflexum balticum DSM 16537]
MKKLLKIVLWTLAILLIVTGSLVYYVSRQMGSLDSLEERKARFSGLTYYDAATDQFISPEELPYYPEQTTGGDAGPARFFKTSPNAPGFPLPKQMITKSDFSETPSDFAAWWFGHSTFILELDGKRILFDPVFENGGPLPFILRRFDVSPIKREELPEIDLVVITHDHYDHLEAATMRFLATRNTEFLVPLGVGARLEGWGVQKNNISELGWHDTKTLGSLQITALPGIHYTSRSYNDRNKTLWASFVIKGDEKNLFVSGDTGYGAHLKDIGEKYGPFDLAFVEIDGWNKGWPLTHLFPDQAVQLCLDINTQLLFPIHWGVFDLAMHPWDESIKMVADMAAENNIELVTPIMGEKVIPGLSPTKNWWEIKNRDR